MNRVSKASKNLFQGSSFSTIQWEASLRCRKEALQRSHGIDEENEVGECGECGVFEGRVDSLEGLERMESDGMVQD